MRRCLLPTGVLAVLLVSPAAAEDRPSGREPAGTLLTKSGTALAREKEDAPWVVLHEKKEVHSRDLVVGLPGARIASANGAVELDFRSDLSNSSPFPIIETAVVLHTSKDVDLDLTLDRGRVELINRKAKGEAKARVRFRTRVWNLTLEKPGTRMTMEIYGRYLPGTRFKPGAKTDGPLTSTVMVVLEGSVFRACDRCAVSMEAAPGPAVFGWDSVTGDDAGPRKLTAAPEWATKKAQETPEAKKKQELLEKFRKKIVEKSLGEALIELVYSEDPLERRLGVYALGAFDQLPSLGDVLTRSKHADNWNNAVVALRHWMGRAPGNDQLLYDKLLKNRHFNPVQARNAMQMLMGYGEEEAGRPELYSWLIEQLRGDKLALRGLAYWHLRRLAPGVEVAFDPAGPREDWDRAYQAYKEKIPTGKLPPAPKDK